MSDNPPSGDTQRSKPAGIDWLATTAGALAAVTSALLLSTLGAVGTLVGAAIGSVAATVGTNLYSQWLAKSQQKVARAQALARWRSAGLAGVRSGSEPVSESAAAAAAESDAGSAETGDAEQAPSWRERLSTLPWKRIGLASLAMFAVVVATITIFELLAGRSVSSIVGGGDGGTTISGVTGGSGRTEKEPRKDPSTGATATPEESSGASADPSEDARESESAAPSEQPSPEASASAGSSAEPSEQPSDGPSEGASTSGGASPSAGASSEAADPASP